MKEHYYRFLRKFYQRLRPERIQIFNWLDYHTNEPVEHELGDVLVEGAGQPMYTYLGEKAWLITQTPPYRGFIKYYKYDPNTKWFPCEFAKS